MFGSEHPDDMRMTYWHGGLLYPHEVNEAITCLDGQETVIPGINLAGLLDVVETAERLIASQCYHGQSP